jgi:hypothetical protein
LRCCGTIRCKAEEFDALPGLLRARRPELYSDLGLPVPGLYDYDAAGG